MIGLDRWERFITARLDADEHTARLAGAPGGGGEWDFDGSGVSNALGEWVASGPYGLHEHQGNFIADYDPARALREIEVRRRVLARHTGVHICPEPPDEATAIVAAEEVTFETPCGDLRDLAAVWADHPDHPDRWWSS